MSWLRRLREKEHEAHIAMAEANKIKRIVSTAQIALQPDLSMSTVLNQKILSQKDEFKRTLRKQLLEPRARGFARLAGGNLNETESAILFDDT